METLRNGRKLKLCVTPIYKINQIAFKLCFLNARSLHKHIEDVRHDLNFTSMDINIFSETRFITLDSDSMYGINGYTLFRNDGQSSINTRPYGGMAVYSRVEFIPEYPRACNCRGVEITLMKTTILPYVSIKGIYRSPRVPMQDLCYALTSVMDVLCNTQFNVFIGDFNVNWLDETSRRHLYNFFIIDRHYRQLISSYTTDNQTIIDHIYTNLPESQITAHILETYFTDHKSICALIAFRN